MSVRNQQVCAWSGPAMIVVMLVGFTIAGFLPPPSPHDSAAQIATIFRAHPDRIRLGLVLTMFGSALLGPFVAVITVQMLRIEGRHAPLAYTQLALGALLALEFIVPVLVLEAAAFRPDLSPSTLRTLDDLGWILFVGAPSTALVQVGAFGVAVLQDRRSRPVFPRWAGHLSLGAALLFAPGGVIVFFTSGALAWNGALAWWVGLTAFGIWLVALTALLLRAVRHQRDEENEIVPAPVAGGVDGRIDALAAEVAALRRQLASATAPDRAQIPVSR